jgi:hypothetical protein
MFVDYLQLQFTASVEFKLHSNIISMAYKPFQTWWVHCALVAFQDHLQAESQPCQWILYYFEIFPGCWELIDFHQFNYSYFSRWNMYQDSSSHSCITEGSHHQGCYAMSTGEWSPMFPRNIFPPHSGSSSARKHTSWIYLTLRMMALCSFEKLVTIYCWHSITSQMTWIFKTWLTVILLLSYYILGWFVGQKKIKYKM